MGESVSPAQPGHRGQLRGRLEAWARPDSILMTFPYFFNWKWPFWLPGNPEQPSPVQPGARPDPILVTFPHSFYLEMAILASGQPSLDEPSIDWARLVWAGMPGRVPNKKNTEN